MTRAASPAWGEQVRTAALPCTDVGIPVSTHADARHRGVTDLAHAHVLGQIRLGDSLQG
jgi:hypothetical protein